MDLKNIQAADFTDQIGSTFDICHTDPQESLCLERVESRRKSPDAKRFRAPFSLYFRGSSKMQYMPQQNLTLKHEKLGMLTLMVMPIGRNEDGSYSYQAVFN